ncbi:MAG: hypothetical protein GY710_04950 [Desulfobacteraceae bacterium]|nr:hypothetical protein [Desulfobacteraceae bacterium]
MKMCKKQFFFLGFLFLSVLLLVTSCGKKGPPLPPIKQGNFLAIPGNVAYSVHGNQLTLTWTHTIDPVNAKIAPEAFDVSMAIKELDGCEGCPFIFKSVGVVPMPHMVYRRLLEPGFHYYFRVQAIGKDGIKSDYSKTLYVKFEQ